MKIRDCLFFFRVLEICPFFVAKASGCPSEGTDSAKQDCNQSPLEGCARRPSGPFIQPGEPQRARAALLRAGAWTSGNQCPRPGCASEGRGPPPGPGTHATPHRQRPEPGWGSRCGKEGTDHRQRGLGASVRQPRGAKTPERQHTKKECGCWAPLCSASPVSPYV